MSADARRAGGTARVRSLMRRTPSERRALFAAAALVPAVRAALWLLPFPLVARAVEWLAVRAGPPSTAGRPAPRPEGIVRAVRSAGTRLLRRKPCLTQALVGLLLMRRAGHPARVHIGVTRNGGPGLHAHAWLESDGAVLLGGRSAPDRYVQLFTLDPDGRP